MYVLIKLCDTNKCIYMYIQYTTPQVTDYLYIIINQLNKWNEQNGQYTQDS